MSTSLTVHAPSGISDRIFSSYLESMAAVMSDAMKPGATALHVIPRPANSRATVFVSPMTPACVPGYARTITLAEAFIQVQPSFDSRQEQHPQVTS